LPDTDVFTIMLADDDLITLLKHDDDAFKIIYHKYSTKLYQSAYNIIRDREACEDIIQELFMEVWLKRKSIKINTSLKSYLFISVKNRVLMKLRSQKITLGEDAMEFLIDNYATDNMTEERSLKKFLAQEVDRLPEKCAEIFRLSRNEQLSNKEIAESLNISVKTVENQISIAIKRLRNSMSEVLSFTIILLPFLKK